MYLVDTSVWIEFLRPGESATSRHLAQLIEGNVHLCINSVIEMEILQGLRSDAQAADMRRYLESFLYFADLPHAYMLEAARIFRACRRAGVTIRKSLDCLIAANALFEELTIVHHDRDFAAIASVCTSLRVASV